MPDAVLAVAALLLGACWLLLALSFEAISRQLRRLDAVLAAEPSPAPAVLGDVPTVSVIVTARDEQATIAHTLRRLLAQSGIALEIVAVDDRSRDRTGALLDELAAEAAAAPLLRVIHNQALPAGWLGKCHACHIGSRAARGRWLLFLDADVELASDDVLARVVALAERHRLDHVSLIPDMRPMGAAQAALVALFGQLFALSGYLWEMDRDRPRGGAGIGAFNLVRRSAYDRIDGHRLLRCDTGDDFKLGALLKETGARQRLYLGLDLVRCPWQAGALNVVRGLDKNFFGAFAYSLSQLAAFTVGLLVVHLGPALLAAVGLARVSAGASPWLALTALPFALQFALLGAGYVVRGRPLGLPPLAFAFHPLAVLLLLAAAWNSAITILARGGVRWRDTFYPLAALKSGRVRSGDGRRWIARQA